MRNEIHTYVLKTVTVINKLIVEMYLDNIHFR